MVQLLNGPQEFLTDISVNGLNTVFNFQLKERQAACYHLYLKGAHCDFTSCVVSDPNVMESILNGMCMFIHLNLKCM